MSPAPQTPGIAESSGQYGPEKEPTAEELLKELYDARQQLQGTDKAKAITRWLVKLDAYFEK